MTTLTPAGTGNLTAGVATAVIGAGSTSSTVNGRRTCTDRDVAARPTDPAIRMTDPKARSTHRHFMGSNVSAGAGPTTKPAARPS